MPFHVRVESDDGQSAAQTYPMRVLPLLRPDESCGANVSWAVATFEDTELEALARRWVDVDDDADLTCASLATVTAAGNGILEPTISSLVGMQNLTGLTSLHLGGSATLTFSDLSPLGGLTTLAELTIAGAPISDLWPLAGLTNLTALGLAGNDIIDLAPLAGLTALVELRLSHNLISDIAPLAGLVNLEVVWIGRGAYAYFQQSGVPAVRGNPITDLSPLAGLTKLRQLWIHGQDVGSLDALAGLESLEDLNAYNSGITDVGPLGGLSGLESLYLSDNSITELDPLAGLTSVGLLYLSGNSITDVGALESLTALSELTLDGNGGLADIQPLLDNPGLGRRVDIPPPNQDYVDLRGTAVPCDQVAALEAKGATVMSDCP